MMMSSEPSIFTVNRLTLLWSVHKIHKNMLSGLTSPCAFPTGSLLVNVLKLRIKYACLY
jgi:hypothetical protein